MTKQSGCLLILIVTLLYSVNSSAENGDQAFAISIADYENSKRTGEIIEHYYVPFPEEYTNGRPLANSPLSIDRANHVNPISQYIIGGNNASRNEYPEYALVLISDGFQSIIGTCGGTLIARNKILTAAHCSEFPASRYFIIPNFYSFNDTLVADDVFEVSSIAIHPDYNDETSESDVAVLTLETNTFSARAKVHAGTNKFVGSDATVIGTGRTRTTPAVFPDVLQEVQTPIVSNNVCNSAWDSAFGFTPITPTMMCAGFSLGGRGSCFGDSGGPLWTDIEGQRALVGTVSFGPAVCEDNREMSAYSRVAALNEFIANQSPETNFIYSDETVTLTPIYDLLLD